MLYLTYDHDNLTEAKVHSPWYRPSGPQCQLNLSVSLDGINVGQLVVSIHTHSGLLTPIKTVNETTTSLRLDCLHYLMLGIEK